MVAAQLYLLTLGNPALQEDSLRARAFLRCGLWACIWATMEVLGLQKCQTFPGDWKHFFLSFSNGPLLIATPDGQSRTLIWLMGESSRMFSVILLQRELQLLEYGRIISEN